MTWPHQRKYKNHFVSQLEWGSSVKMSKDDQICQTAKMLLQAWKHTITKGCFSLPLSDYYDVNLSCTKLNPLKIDKRGKLLKVNIVSDAELLFWSDTKRDTKQKKKQNIITSYFIRNQNEDYKAVTTESFHYSLNSSPV